MTQYRGPLFVASLIAIPIGVGVEFGLGWAIISAGLVGALVAVGLAVEAAERKP